MKKLREEESVAALQLVHLKGFLEWGEKIVAHKVTSKACAQDKEGLEKEWT